jgi:hypothetical protein
MGIKLKLLLKMYILTMWIGFIWLQIGNSGWFLYISETSGSEMDREIFD